MLAQVLPALGAPAGAAAGGMLGQVSDLLSAPRRGLWSMLGLPDSGSELLHQSFGMDPENALTKALGIGAEMVADPLTYALAPLGGLAGRLGGEALGANAARKAALEGTVSELAATRKAAEAAMVQHELAKEAVAAGQSARFEGMRSFVDPGSLAGPGRRYAHADPMAADLMENLGLGIRGEGDSLSVQSLHPNLSHADKAGTAGVPPSFLQTRPGRGVNLHMREGWPAPGGLLEQVGLPTAAEAPSPYERYLLMREAAANPEFRSIHSAADPLADVGARRGAELAPAMPHVRGLPADALHQQTQNELLKALGELEALKYAGRLSPLERAAVAGTSAGSVGTGIYHGLPQDQRPF